MNTLVQKLSSLAFARIERARNRAESLITHAIACAGPLETLAREAKLSALTKLETLLREAGAPTLTIEREIRAQSEAKIASLEERIRQLESELSIARANSEKARAARPSRRRSAVAADAPRLDA